MVRREEFGNMYIKCDGGRQKLKCEIKMPAGALGSSGSECMGICQCVGRRQHSGVKGKLKSKSLAKRRHDL